MFLDNFIDEAIKESKKSNMNFKHGAIIIYRNKIISRGYNRYFKYNRLKSGKYFSIHAEVMAIRNCQDHSILPKCVMIVVRAKNNKSRPSKPCRDCQKYLKKMKIHKILHS